MPRKKKSNAPGTSGPPGTAPPSATPSASKPPPSPSRGAPPAAKKPPPPAQTGAPPIKSPPPPAQVAIGGPPPAQGGAPAKPSPAKSGPPAGGPQLGLDELDQAAFREAEKYDMLAIYDDIQKYGWSTPPAPTYLVPDWVKETGQDPLPEWMFAPNGYLLCDPTYDPWPSDFVPGKIYETSLMGPDEFPMSGGGGGFGGGGGGGGGRGGFGGDRGGRGGFGGDRGGDRGGRGGGRGRGRGVCNSMRDRGTCRFGADCQYSHDLSSPFALGDRPGGGGGGGRGGGDRGGRGGGDRGGRGGRGRGW